ncbi:deacylase [Paenibacillus chitinolyticus]|uniref:Deacylase n=1 Tax=Paenibacillus chitinolyticus TaxID=79263 RepID=A0A410WUY0_9BACL|nr:succinylglutamate desuccinylase/aspartoacylase family protein [Paenibacillus chitinolyticus]MCY9589474.1 succinylglutamate desuccinylase/aspartoacylase family protein [Paenibacillus chitinolyticus]MCY9599248.1 succinylglutamate desuccinylase/aspartoacylase family protein [Paenibacillus chitinolyticus]QAV18208.1 deacylase [Paenibacillus chitinolyticus]
MQITKHQLAKGTKFETPYYIIKGNTAGKTVMITAGVHGDETANVLAAKKLVDLLQKNVHHIDKGTLIIVPIVNQIAYKRRFRGIPDLNRTFPCKPNVAARHPLASELFRLAKQFQPEWYIDLHEARGFSKIDPSVLGQTLLTNPRSEAIPLVKRIVNHLNRSIAQKSRQFSIRIRHLPGSGRTAAYRLLKSNSITVETSTSMPKAIRVEYQMKILRYLLNETGLIKDERTSATA